MFVFADRLGNRGGRGHRSRGTGWRLLLVCVALMGAGCESDGPDPLAVSVEDGTSGHYGGPCNPDGSCGEGLICEHHVCKEKD